MILIICALYPEAQPLIKSLSLVQDKNERYYKKYSNDENDICLWITGTGPLSASTAVGYALSSCENSLDNIHILNFGCCAFVNNRSDKSSAFVNNRSDKSPAFDDDKTCVNNNTVINTADSKASLYLCNKLVNVDSGRSFYPDLLLKSDLDEAAIVTGSKIFKAEDTLDVIGSFDINSNDDLNSNDVNSNDDHRNSDANNKCFVSPVLYDMEAAAIYESASHFVGPHQMHFLKFVTDQGEGRITADFVRQKASEACVDVVTYIEMLKMHMASGSVLEEEDSADTLQLFEELHASVTMQWQIRQLLRYATVAGIDYDSKLAELSAKNELPCKDKRTGLKILEELRDYISCC
jgi:hypothetical protein